MNRLAAIIATASILATLPVGAAFADGFPDGAGPAFRYAPSYHAHHPRRRTRTFAVGEGVSYGLAPSELPRRPGVPLYNVPPKRFPSF